MLNAIVAGIVTVMVTALVGVLAWIGNNVVDLKTESAVISTKVEANHAMLTVLWEDKIKGGSYDLSWVNLESDNKTAAKEEIR